MDTDNTDLIFVFYPCSSAQAVSDTLSLLLCCLTVLGRIVIVALPVSHPDLYTIPPGT